MAAVTSAAESAVAGRFVEPLPASALVPLAEAEDVLLLCDRRSAGDFHAETYSQQMAFGHELAARGRTFAITDDASELFEKSVSWALPSEFVRPRLWNHARQVQQFVAGLEAQGNRAFVSAAEAAFWENKAYMHQRLDEVGAATPRTLVVTDADRAAADLAFEPVVIKQEHSAGSAGISFFATAAEARAFLAQYRFRPEESLIVQEIVSGATRDLRLTVVGDRAIRSATYWRIKSDAALAAPEWTTTATTYGAEVVHEEPPVAAVERCAKVMADLGVRTAGIDLMWVDDDVSGDPLILELSPFYQPNPPRPAGRSDRPYKAFKRRRYAADGYYKHQHLAYRDIAAAVLDQGLF